MLARLKCGTKIVAGFGTVIAILAVVAFVSWDRLSRVGRLIVLDGDAGSALKSLLDAHEASPDVAAADRLLLCEVGLQRKGRQLDWHVVFVPTRGMQQAMQRSLQALD